MIARVPALPLTARCCLSDHCPSARTAPAVAPPSCCPGPSGAPSCTIGQCCSRSLHKSNGGHKNPAAPMCLTHSSAALMHIHVLTTNKTRSKDPNEEDLERFGGFRGTDETLSAVLRLPKRFHQTRTSSADHLRSPSTFGVSRTSQWAQMLPTASDQIFVRATFEPE